MPDHPVYAALYDRMTAPAEAAGLAERRRRLLAGATGRVLEVGGGTGANLAHYRAAASVDVLEPDGAMRRRLERRLEDEVRAGRAAAAVRVHAAGIDDAPFPDRSFDTAVCTLVLCTVPDLPRALGTLRRLLRPGGTLLFLEHVRASGPRASAQRALTPLWSRLVPGCHLDRDTVAAVRRAGFFVTDAEKFALPGGGPLLATAVSGAARPAPAA